jgi:NAD(P)-dependent dehydrogenase (short-subunit alcohol dehydrogenase family)/acyl carrier protein
LKRGGVYLITGGTGGIGLALARRFATTCQATLVLTKKTPLSERAKRAVQEIEQAGARVEVAMADVCDAARMQEVVDGALEKYGRLDGVIHAAGIVRAGLMQVKARETADSVLAPKVHGTRVLYEALKKARPDFLVLFSSMSAVTMPYAECDYSAANAFLDAFTHFANREGGFRTLTINWPGWKEAGMLAELQLPAGMEAWKQAQLERAIASRDGVEAFERALGSGLKQVVVSPENLEQLIAEARAPVDPAAYLQREKAAEGVDSAPDDTVEGGLAAIWASVFGLPRVGAAERFADLGGHSLLAMQIVAKVRARYGIDFTLKEFFEAPTIAQASPLIEARIIADIEQLSDEQARALVSRD